MPPTSARRPRNSGARSFSVWLPSITVVAVSRMAWALAPGAAVAAEPATADPRPPPAWLSPAQPPINPEGRGAPADAPSEPAKSYRKYRLALGAGVATGGVGWGSGLGTLLEVYARAQVQPWLGIGVAYYELSAQNDDNYPPFEAHALELNAAWHPFRHPWLDPYVQLGALRRFGVSGAPFDLNPQPWAAEGQLGLDFVLSPLAIGLQARHGLGDHAWSLLGLQVEGRI